MRIIFLNSKGIVHKEFVLAGQTVNSAYYCDFYGDCVKMCGTLRSKFGDKRTGYCITTTHRLTYPLPPGNFWPKDNVTVVPSHLSFLFPQLKIGRRFDITEVNKASHAVLITFAEDDVQNAFKNGRSAGNGARKGSIRMVMMANRPKVSF
jgi:hypothetical protein